MMAFMAVMMGLQRYYYYFTYFSGLGKDYIELKKAQEDAASWAYSWAGIVL